MNFYLQSLFVSKILSHLFQIIFYNLSLINVLNLFEKFKNKKRVGIQTQTWTFLATFLTNQKLQSTPNLIPKLINKSRSTKNAKFNSQKKKVNDDFDDLLDNLMNKEQMKKSRKNVEPSSSKYLTNNNDIFGKTLERFPTSNNLQTEINLFKNNTQGLNREANRGSRKSILDELMADDNKSQKSVVTGRRGELPVQSLGFINTKGSIVEDTPLAQANIRGGMRPPLKKRPQSREGSVIDGDKGKIEQDQIQGDGMLKLVKRNTVGGDNRPKQENNNQFQSMKVEQFGTNDKFINPQSQPVIPQISFRPNQTSSQQPSSQPSPQPLIQQKLIQKHIPIPPAQLSKQHEEEIKLIKQSYQRQISLMKDNYQKLIKQQSNVRKEMVNMMEQAVEKEKEKWEKVIREETKRVKEVCEWEIKKKTQAYEMQTQRLKQLLDTVAKSQHIQTQITQQPPSLTQLHQLSIKQKQLSTQRQSLDHQRIVIQTNRRNLQSQQHEFQLYRKRQQQKIADEKKVLFEQQMQLRKMHLQQKKQIMAEKQFISTQLVDTELTIQQQKQTLKHEVEKLNIERQLFIQQKAQFQRINQKIMNDLKDRKKELDKEKQKITQLEVQLYKKINQVEMTGVERGLIVMEGNRNRGNKLFNNTALITSNNNNLNYTLNNRHMKENNRNRINSELNDKIIQTKQRYAEMEKLSQTNSFHSNSQRNSLISGPKIQLQQYIDKLTQNKLKIGK